MNMWEIREEHDYERDFGMRGDEVEEAYREGCKRGYEKAMREMGMDMGMRGGYGRGEGGYGERRMMPPYRTDYPMGMRDPYMDDEMGERRRRRSNGQWY